MSATKKSGGKGNKGDEQEKEIARKVLQGRGASPGSAIGVKRSDTDSDTDRQLARRKDWLDKNGQ